MGEGPEIRANHGLTPEEDEAQRLRSLHQSNLLDTPEDPRFDTFTRLATRIFGVPISLVTLVDATRQWAKSAVGAPQGMAQSRDISFCAHALQSPDQVFLVEDTAQDARFIDNPLVVGWPGIRFYAGAPVRDEEGRALGALCIIDTSPRKLTDQDLSMLRDLAFAVSSIIRMEQAMAAWRESEENYRWAVALDPQIPWTSDPAGQLLTVGPRLLDQLGLRLDEVLGNGWLKGVLAEEQAAVAEAWASSVLHRQPLDIAFRFELKDGSRRWFRSRASARTDTSGNVIRWYGVIEDVHDAKLGELEVKRSAERLDNVLESTTDLVVFFDLEWRLTYMNHSLLRIPAYAASMGKIVWDALPYLRGTDYEHQLRQAQTTKLPTTFEWFAVGLGFWIEVNAYPAADGTAVFLRNIAERHILAGAQREAREALDHQAHHDALTGLPNRLLLQKMLHEKLRHSSGGEVEFALLHVGLDGFKHVNDTLGPAIGDRVLSLASERFKAVMGTGERLARLSGDVFAVLQSGVRQPSEAERFAEKLTAAVSLPFEIDANVVVIGASVGVALAPIDGADVDHLLQAADIALYRAKELRGGSWARFVPQMQLELENRQSLRIGLREGLASDEFSLVYQPLIDLPSGNIGGFEALMRWRHPKRGFVPPTEFIEIAEESGIIIPMGFWALRKACRDAMGWPTHIRVAVNLSPIQFRDPKLVEEVASILVETGLAPGRLKLEITETVLLQDNNSNLATLHALQRLGVLIVLDDFGTGYSSLSYLQRFPFDKIKIDQGFINRIPEEEESQSIVRSILSLARALRIGTTAEGVERSEQLDWLRVEGCGQIQGYLFSRPMPADQVLAYIAEQSPVAAVASMNA